MREVSVDALDLVYRVAQGLGRTREEVSAAFRVPPVLPKRLDWDDFVAGMAWLGSCTESVESLADASARHFLEIQSYRPMMSVLRLMTSPREIYYVGHRWGGHGLFNNGKSEYAVIGPTRVRFKLTYSGVAAPPSFHALTAGAFRAVPRIFGYADSSVRFEISGNSCEYFIDHAPSRSIFARIRALFLSIFSRSGVLDELEQQKNALTEQLVDLDRAHRQSEEALAMMARFLGTVTHELRTPLAGIIGVADLVHDNALTRVEQDALVRDIRSSATRLLKIVNDVVDLDASTEQGDPPRHRDLAVMVRAIAAPFVATAQARAIALDVSVDPSLPACVLLQPAQLSKALAPILDNAVRFTERGRIDVRVSPGTRGASTLVVRVSDTGPGVPSALQGRIFEPFFQVDQRMTRQHGGVGLGLAVSRQLARAVDGEVRLESSTSERGSVFALEWPYLPGSSAEVTSDILAPASNRAPVILAKSSPSAPSAHVAVTAPAQGQRRRALVVEDNMVNQRILAKILATLDVDCDIAADGAIAVREHEKRPYDVIFMDLQMPVMDGFQATEAIRRREAQSRHTPIVGVTANSDRDYRERAIAAGMDQFIPKPIQRTVIAEALARISN